MKKALKLIAISTAMASIASTIALICIYLEDIAGFFRFCKTKLSNIKSKMHR